MRALISWLLILCTAPGCSVILEWKDNVLSTAANSVPWEFEHAMGDKLLPAILDPQRELVDPTSVAQLERLLKPLTANVKQPKIRIHISKDNELNAFAIPGGHLIFNRGMLLSVETPEEILGVAAHEISHATERHSLRSMIQGLSLYAAITLFLGDVSGLGAILIDQGQALIQNGFSRSQERAADRIGVERLLEAGINPAGMIHFFERLQKESQGDPRDSSRVAQFMSTHPSTVERIDEIKKLVASRPDDEKRGWKPIAFDLKAFQAGMGR
jgi:predicted Zn-dependent protease